MMTNVGDVVIGCHRGTGGARLLFIVGLAVTAFVGAARASDEDCLQCHGSLESARDAAAALELALSEEGLKRLVVPALAGSVHEPIGCLACHDGAQELPHKSGLLDFNPCASCHEDSLAAVNRSVHGDPTGGTMGAAPCWACHTAHEVKPVKASAASVAPSHVAERCLQCHDKGEYLIGVHGRGVTVAGLDLAATCVSCHGAHDILDHGQAGSRVARRNISFTCGRCHGRVAESYRSSIHGAALMETDNPDVPTCVDCHEAHGTVDPVLPRFRQGSPEICGKCHADAGLMGKYGLSTQVFATYVADFHGTTAELFRAVTPDQPLNQAVCYDCHGHHDVESVRRAGAVAVEQRLLVRCQHCHPGATSKFLSAWSGHYVPSPGRYPLIYYVRLFYNLVIPATIGFFLLYIAVDVMGRRRQRRSS